jgi:flagellar assembly protein FliH
MSPKAVPARDKATVEPFDYGPRVPNPSIRLVTSGGAPRPAQVVPRAAPPPADARGPVPEPPPIDAAAARTAFEEGYAKGEQAGIHAAARQLDAQRARLANALEELAVLGARVTHRIERQVVNLAIAIASRILHREVTLDRDLLLVMARVALDRMGDVPSAVVRLHPDDEAAVRQDRASWPAGATIEIVADPGVKPGGCILQTDLGHVDLGLDAQLGELTASLLGGPRTPLTPDIP